MQELDRLKAKKGDDDDHLIQQLNELEEKEKQASPPKAQIPLHNTEPERQGQGEQLRQEQKQESARKEPPSKDQNPESSDLPIPLLLVGAAVCAVGFYAYKKYNGLSNV